MDGDGGCVGKWQSHRRMGSSACLPFVEAPAGGGTGGRRGRRGGDGTAQIKSSDSKPDGGKDRDGNALPS